MHLHTLVLLYESAYATFAFKFLIFGNKVSILTAFHLWKRKSYLNLKFKIYNIKAISIFFLKGFFLKIITFKGEVLIFMGISNRNIFMWFFLNTHMTACIHLPIYISKVSRIANTHRVVTLNNSC